MLARFLDGTLAEEDRSRVECHAAECSPCRRLLILSARTLNEPAPVRKVMWSGWAAAAAAALLIAAALAWVAVSPPRETKPATAGGDDKAAQAQAGIEREMVAAALKGLLKRGYEPLEVTRLVARTAGAGIRGQDMVDLVRAMEQAASDLKDPSRLRDEAIEAASSGSSGPELRRLIWDRLRELPVVSDDRTNG